MQGKELNSIIYNCPFCEKEHEIKVLQYIERTTVKDEEIEYLKTCYYCSVEEDEFVPSKLADMNLLAAKDAYREKHGLLKSVDIKNIREQYGLTQKEYANLLGLGDVTIQRYEKKAIQDSTYDTIMRLTFENPSYCLEMLEKNRVQFEDTRYEEIRAAIVLQIKKVSETYFLKESVKAQYVEYSVPCIENGFRVLDLEKLNNVLGYLASYIPNLYKVKLMKLLWYVDAISFKKYHKTMTGLVYQHMPLGAVPVAHYDIMKLPAICVEEEEFEDSTSYRIRPACEISIGSFSFDELEVLNEVIRQFKDFSTKRIVQYMHLEKAYQMTQNKEIIPFHYADELNLFS